VLNAARAMPEWPTGQFKLRLNAPTLEGAAGIVKYEEIGGTSHIEAMRKCVREAIKAAGGVSAEGSADRSSARALPGAPKGEPAPHIPNIVHSTVLRWAAEPTEDECAAARAPQPVSRAYSAHPWPRLRAPSDEEEPRERRRQRGPRADCRWRRCGLSAAWADGGVGW
jgi:hypothetical protein